MGFQVAAVAPSPSSPSSPSTSSSRPLPAFLGGGRCAGGLPAVNWRTGVAMVRRRPRLARMPPARCALSASLDGTGGGGDAEFMKRIEELAAAAGVPPPGAAGCCGGWPAASVERSATNVGLPLSLRMLKRRKQQQQQVAAAAARQSRRPLLGDSVRRAFSSMVLIVRELQSFALRQMRLRGGVVARVQAEMHASFVWLFQHIFACTPALMLSLMLLLANFTVHSMGHTAAAAAAAAVPPSPPAAAAAAALVVVDTTQRAEPRRFDVKTPFPVSGRTASVGGHSGGGGGNTPPPVAGATGDGRSDESSLYYRLRSRVAPPQPSAPPALGEVAAQDDDAGNTDEQAVWETMLAEASEMQASSEELSDSDVLRGLVAPVQAEVLETGEDHHAVAAEHTVTQRWYEHAVAAEPNNSLILANFAQFLYLVQSDHDRAEHYFKRAVRAEPADSEALSWYATFLWKARDDVAGAEESYQEAIAADPGNAHHAAAYAHFLWNTAGASTGAAKQ